MTSPPRQPVPAPGGDADGVEEPLLHHVLEVAAPGRGQGLPQAPEAGAAVEADGARLGVGVAVEEGVPRPPGPRGHAGDGIGLLQAGALLAPADADLEGEPAPVHALVPPAHQVAPGQPLVMAGGEVLVRMGELALAGPGAVDRLVRVEEPVGGRRAQRPPR